MARICVAEDDADIRHLLTFALAAAGHEVSVAKNGAEVLRIFKEETAPDLLILDIMMPGMDGYEVLETMNDEDLRSGSRVLVFTARDSERDRDRGFSLGADRYLVKPFDPDELVRIVNKTLAETEEELRSGRDQEWDKAKLLSRLESIFGE